MGVDTKIILPAAARIDDVADVIAALAGFQMEKCYFNTKREDDGWSAGYIPMDLNTCGLRQRTECHIARKSYSMRAMTDAS